MKVWAKVTFCMVVRCASETQLWQWIFFNDSWQYSDALIVNSFFFNLKLLFLCYMYYLIINQFPFRITNFKVKTHKFVFLFIWIPFSFLYNFYFKLWIGRRSNLYIAQSPKMFWQSYASHYDVIIGLWCHDYLWKHLMWPFELWCHNLCVKYKTSTHRDMNDIINCIVWCHNYVWNLSQPFSWSYLFYGYNVNKYDKRFAAHGYQAGKIKVCDFSFMPLVKCTTVFYCICFFVDVYNG